MLDFAFLVEESTDRLGLVARGDRGRLFSRHFLESLAPPYTRRIPRDGKLLDVGSGGGFPGIPTAILREDSQVTLVEPRERKAAFLERAILSLGLSRATVFQGTVEELGRLGREPEFDAAVSRGLRWTREMLRGLDAVLVPGGFLIRFGSIQVESPGVTTEPLSPDADRGVQVWDRAAWEHLPGAA